MAGAPQRPARARSSKPARSSRQASYNTGKAQVHALRGVSLAVSRARDGCDHGQGTVISTLTVPLLAFLLAPAPSSGPVRREGLVGDLERFALPVGLVGRAGSRALVGLDDRRWRHVRCRRRRVAFAHSLVLSRSRGRPPKAGHSLPTPVCWVVDSWGSRRDGTFDKPGAHDVAGVLARSDARPDSAV